MSKNDKKQFPVWLFGIVFLVIIGIVFLNRVMSISEGQIYVANNTGVSDLLTQGQNLIVVFQDGKVAAWDWSNPSPEPLWKISASDRFVMLDDTRAAAVSKTGRKNFTVYDVKTGSKISETPVGWEDQDIWLLQSPDKKILALACINPDKDGHTLYEYMFIDPAKGKPNMPVSIDVLTGQKRFLAFAVSNDKKILAAGSAGKHGWLTVVELNEGKVILEKQYEQTDEFTGVALTPNGSLAFLSNHDGFVYGIDRVSGEVKSNYTVLKPGEINPVTNDGSSQNAVVSADGQLVAAVMMERKVAVWDIQSGKTVFQGGPDHKLVGSIVLSGDSKLLATSDKRADGTVQILRIKK